MLSLKTRLSVVSFLQKDVVILDMDLTRKKGIIVGGGPVNYRLLNNELKAGYDLLVAADGGGKPLYDLCYIPQILLGDFDSLAPAYKELITAQGAKMISYKKEKDWTDLELSIKLLMDRGINNIRVFGGLGGRLDHTLANLSLLYRAKISGFDVTMIGKEEMVILLSSEEQVILSPFAGGHFSLLPLFEVAEGVNIKGAKFPLENATIKFGSTIGIHNEFLETSVGIGFRSGYLYLIVEGIHEYSGEQDIFQRIPV